MVMLLKFGFVWLPHQLMALDDIKIAIVNRKTEYVRCVAYVPDKFDHLALKLHCNVCLQTFSLIWSNV